MRGILRSNVEKKIIVFSQILSLHYAHTIQERLKETPQHLSGARHVGGDSLIFSADQLHFTLLELPPPVHLL